MKEQSKKDMAALMPKLSVLPPGAVPDVDGSLPGATAQVAKAAPEDDDNLLKGVIIPMGIKTAPPGTEQSNAFMPSNLPSTKVEVVAKAEDKPSWGLPSSVIGDLLIGQGGEERVDIDAVLKSVDGLTGGPSSGGFSWHTLETCMKCWRLAYYTHVMGLVPKQRGHALGFGTLYHACWELWYKYGGQRSYDEPCDAIRKAGAPKVAGEVQRLVYTELLKYAKQESEEWDIRAVENNAVCWAPPERINGKTVHIPFSCRHDMLIAKRSAGQPCAPLGPVPSGVWVVDRKTASALTYDLTKGYAMDGQFLMNALVYKRSTEEQEFGPFQGMIFAVAVKHKDPQPDKSYFRVETVVDDSTLDEFFAMEVMPFAREFYQRLSTPAYQADPRLWPKNHASCVGRYGCCRFFDVCDVGGDTLLEAMFMVDEGRKLKVENLAEPPAEVKRAVKMQTDPEFKTKEDKRKEKAGDKKRVGACLLESFRAGALEMDIFNSKHYVVPNHTPKTILDQLQFKLSTAWERGTIFEFGPDMEGRYYTIIVEEKGLGWAEIDTETKEKNGYKGRMTWKSLSEAICRDWWDLKNLDPLDSGRL